MGEAQKRRAATALNDRSTRAHSIFILTLKQRRHTSSIDDDNADADTDADTDGEVTAGSGAPMTTTTLTSKLFLADLGGSEQVKKSQVEVGKSKKYPAKETDATVTDLKASANSDADDENDRKERDQALFSTGFEMAERMREAVYINLGLLALKKCIEALNAKSSYVPYQVCASLIIGLQSSHLSFFLMLCDS